MLFRIFILIIKSKKKKKNEYLVKTKEIEDKTSNHFVYFTTNDCNKSSGKIAKAKYHEQN